MKEMIYPLLSNSNKVYPYLLKMNTWKSALLIYYHTSYTFPSLFQFDSSRAYSKLILDDLKNFRSLSAFKSKLKKRNTDKCPCKICRDYINGNGYINQSYQIVLQYLNFEDFYLFVYNSFYIF